MPVNCPQCGAPIGAGANRCEYCGETIAAAPPVQQAPHPPVYQQPMYQQPPAYPPPPMYQQPIYQQPANGVSPMWPIKSKTAAGVLGILLGGLGIHKFYLGKIGMGVLYLLFCWTGIPAIIGFIEGIVYLCSNDINFQLKHQVRLQ